MATWSVPFDKLAEKTGRTLEDTMRAAAIDLFSRVVIRSPVDTGRFRANWNVSHQNLDLTTRVNFDKTGAEKIKQISDAVLAMPAIGTYWLANSLPYARVLEYGEYPDPPKGGAGKTRGGFSTQAPQGMVRISAREFSAAVEKAVRKKK